MPENPVDDLSAPSFLIFISALALTALSGIVVNFGVPLVGAYASYLLQQIFLLVGVNAALVTAATYFVILVGNVKRGR